MKLKGKANMPLMNKRFLKPGHMAVAFRICRFQTLMNARLMERGRGKAASRDLEGNHFTRRL